jgi:hypothetical protein
VSSESARLPRRSTFECAQQQPHTRACLRRTRPWHIQLAFALGSPQQDLRVPASGEQQWREEIPSGATGPTRSLMASSSRDELMAQLVDMGYSQLHAATYSLRYPSLESALEHLLAAEAAGQLEADPQQQPMPSQPLQRTPLDSLLEEHKEPHCDLQPSTAGAVTWQPLRRSSLPPLADALPVAAVAETESTPDGEEVDQLHLLASCHATPAVHTHLLQQWTHSTCTTVAGSPSLSSSQASVLPSCDSIEASPALQPIQQLISTTTATLTTLVLSTPAHSPKQTQMQQPTDDEQEDNCCDVCLDAPKVSIDHAGTDWQNLLPCQHVSLCSGCTEAYFRRTSDHNVGAANLRRDAEAEAARAPRFAASAHSVVLKNADRIVSCPCCSQTVQVAIRKSSSPAISRRASAASELSTQ